MSLLNPPNPSLSPFQHPNSILLNCPGRPRPSSSDPNVNVNKDGNTSNGNSIREPPSPGSLSTSVSDASLPVLATPDASSSASATLTSASASASGSVRPVSAPGSARVVPLPSPKIKFGPLPERPPELKRRSSITLGVLARKDMLSSQGTGTMHDISPSGGGIQKVYMTDEEWAQYKRDMANRNGVNPVDIGSVVASGAKNLWRKVRRGSASSLSSTTSSFPSSPQPNTSTLGPIRPPRSRADSDPAVLRAPSLSAALAAAAAMSEIQEEDEPRSAPGSPPPPHVPRPSHGLSLSGLEHDGPDSTPRHAESPEPLEAGATATATAMNGSIPAVKNPPPDEDERDRVARSARAAAARNAVGPRPSKERNNAVLGFDDWRYSKGDSDGWRERPRPRLDSEGGRGSGRNATVDIASQVPKFF